MKKIILSLTMILFTAAAFSQKLVPVKIDSLITVSLPEKFQKKDTLGQQIYTGNGAVGYIMVIRAPNAPNNKPLNKERDLNEVLKTYIDGIQKQSVNGSVMFLRDSTIAHLKAKVFTLRVDNSASTGESPQLRNFILIYTQEATYTLEYFYPEARIELAKSEAQAFSSSIKIAPELNRTDQYISNAKGISFGTKVALYGGLPIVIIIVLIIVIRNKKRRAEEAL
jgi:hypothetical protein